ncbi:MAG TPA: hypothetical protein VLF89_06555 [Candidatus Saccharimonadales bacterium]|nr:hypothetical protein [Candidatus Saccharimonadales bacterium]
MLAIIIILLIVLWYLGYIQIPALPFLNNTVFVINSHPVTIWEVLVLLVIAWAIGVLPSPLKQIAGVLLILWILATLGFIAVVGFSSIVVIAIIVGLIFFFLEGGM